jgi:hypothetical protein
MKTKIFSFGCSLFFLLNTNGLFSQAPAKRTDLNNTVAVAPGRPRIISNSMVDMSNRKIEKKFAGDFAGVTDQSWSMAGKNFHCSFHIHGNPSTALFTKNGSLVYFVMHGNEKDLPSDVRKIVKSEYFDYAIIKAVEVKQNKEEIWIVNLKENLDHITVRVADGEMEVVERFEEPL